MVSVAVGIFGKNLFRMALYKAVSDSDVDLIILKLAHAVQGIKSFQSQSKRNIYEVIEVLQPAA